MPLPSRRALSAGDLVEHYTGEPTARHRFPNVLLLFIPHQKPGIKAIRRGFARPATGLQPIGNLAAKVPPGRR